MVRPMTARHEANAKTRPVVGVGAARFGNDLPLALIAGPCALESRAHALETAAALKEIAARLGIGLVYKTSFDKANRTSARSARAASVSPRRCRSSPRSARSSACRCSPTCMSIEQCARVAEAVDVLQIPAFLCRQTDLLVAAAQTGKRGQREEGPVPRALGHEECRRQDRRRRQPATCWSPSAASPSATTRSSPTCARCRSSPRPARR